MPSVRTLRVLASVVMLSTAIGCGGGDDDDDDTQATSDGSVVDGDGGAGEGDSNAVCDMFVDGDSDGFGVGDAETLPCDTDGYSAESGDCDDENEAISPNGVEVADDGVDQDCDGTEQCYADEDNDGYRTDILVNTASLDCSGGNVAPGSAPNGDCIDSNAMVNPGQEAFFPTDRGDGSFDYNCNDTQEKQIVTEAGDCPASCPTFPVTTSVASGWISSFVPECGDTGTFVSSCTTNQAGGGCNPLIGDPVTQRCR